MNSRILYTKPSITDLEVQYASDAARNGWGENCYDYIVKFENLFKDHLGVDFAIATSSCTGALHMGLAGLNIGPGDEVIVPSFTWIATANSVEYCGATPVLCDVEIDSYNISIESIITHIPGEIWSDDIFIGVITECIIYHSISKMVIVYINIIIIGISENIIR